MELNKNWTFYNRFKRQFLSRVWLARTVIFLVVIGLGVILWTLWRSPLKTAFQSVGTPLPATSGRVNFLLMGKSGPGHEGPDLTDTMILASVKVDTGETTLISIPRDLWLPSLAAKINTAYYYGLSKQGTAGGLVLAKAAVTEVTNQPVHFAAALDFSTFTKAIDLIGGVEVQVEHTFDDYEFPIPGKEDDPCNGDPEFKCRFEHIHFDAGTVHMDGTTALKFVRSRHAEGDEGTDFARSARQRQVIKAVRNKLLSLDVLAHPTLYQKLVDLFKSGFVTDIKPEYYSALLQLALKMRKQEPRNFAIAEPDQVYNPPPSVQYDNQWILLPLNNDPNVIFDYVAGLLK